MMDLHKNNKGPSDVGDLDGLIPPIYDNLYRYIYCILRNKVMAEDAMQNTLVKVWGHIGELKDKSKFKSWIYSIGRNESINILRKYSREVLSDDVVCDVLDNGYISIPEDFILENEIRKLVVRAVNDLGTEDRYIIILRYYAGLTFKEIAQVLNINCNTVRTRHRSIKRKLYERLKNEGAF